MNIAGLSTLFLRLCMYNNLLDSLRKKYNHLLPTEYKKISYKDCYNNISKIQTFTFLSKKTQNEIK
ncbi:hypothetical protein AB837_00219 [bacterium AB1]|nr:hypothetical protein AB837_00219 [bacterium AB1]